MPDTDSHSAKRRTYWLGHFEARATSGSSPARSRVAHLEAVLQTRFALRALSFVETE